SPAWLLDHEQFSGWCDCRASADADADLDTAAISIHRDVESFDDAVAVQGEQRSCEFLAVIALVVVQVRRSQQPAFEIVHALHCVSSASSRKRTKPRDDVRCASPL